MSVIDLARLIDEARAGLDGAAAAFHAEAQKVAELKAKHAHEIAMGQKAVDEAAAVVSSFESKLRDFSSQMMHEMGVKFDNEKAAIMAAMKNRK